MPTDQIGIWCPFKQFDKVSIISKNMFEEFRDPKSSEGSVTLPKRATTMCSAMSSADLDLRSHILIAITAASKIRQG